MAYTEFPSNAQFLLDGYKLSAGGGVDRDEMDDGYIQQTPNASATRYEVPLTYRLASLADMEAFEAWRHDDLVNGALHFAWTDPRYRRNGTVRRARIVKGEVTYMPMDRAMGDWTASFVLEYFD